MIRIFQLLFCILFCITLSSCKSKKINGTSYRPINSLASVKKMTEQSLFRNINTLVLGQMINDSATIYIDREYLLRKSLLSDQPYGISNTQIREIAIYTEEDTFSYAFKGEESDTINKGIHIKYYNLSFDLEIPIEYTPVYKYFEPPLDIFSFCHNIWFYSPVLPTEDKSLFYQQALSVQLKDRRNAGIVKTDRYFELMKNGDIRLLNEYSELLGSFNFELFPPGTDKCSSN